MRSLSRILFFASCLFLISNTSPLYVYANSENAGEVVLEPAQSNFDRIFKRGDLIFIQSTSQQSKAISEVTKSIWTHVGILNKNEKGEWEVIEAVSTVKATPVLQFIGTQRSVPGKNLKNPNHGRFVVKRLKQGTTDKSGKVIDLANIKDWSRLQQALMAVDDDITIDPLKDKSDSKKLKEAYAAATQKKSNVIAPVQRQKYIGKSYDIFFEWSNDVIYCSELTYKAYFDAFGIELGKIQTWGDLKTQGFLDGPKAKALVEARLGRSGKVFNHDEKILTPEAQYQSPILETAYDSDWYY